MRVDRTFPANRAVAGVVLVVVLASGLSVGPAHALGGIVHDPIQTARHLAEFREQLARWRATVAHYQQQLIRLRGMEFAPTAMDAAFPEVPEEYGVEDACRKGDTGVIGEITEFFRPSADAEIIEQQLLICKRIVKAENMKYNETVRFLNNMRARQQALARIDTARAGVGTEQGRLQSINFDLERYEKSTKMDHDRWSAMIVAYDNYIASLNRFQVRLSERALKGKQPDVFSAVVQGEVLRRTLREMREP